MLPWVERLGYDVPPWDFRVPGVTSISADLHKYGYATKGASVVLHRPKTNLRYQVFQFADWPGGIYGTQAFQGTKPAPPIAAAWAVLHLLGEEGYMKLAAQAMDAAPPPDRRRERHARRPRLGRTRHDRRRHRL